jgi:hypothetical protein
MAHSAGCALSATPPMPFHRPWSGHLFVSNQFVSILKVINILNNQINKKETPDKTQVPSLKKT